ncbi:EamA family transporter RarD [Pelagivirga sediminicola]|uniref:EamA family transporter RarD n=1 Tax=Pelagivirga sediminicola TaxID=2170575 RepID=A0A2T7G983_9RHOB|nr:EamA family transporter RarD [Pelagivirga sediminicola]PVA10982.1 EamA family transporter RarD [Pelagivirga sediminicola]
MTDEAKGVLAMIGACTVWGLSGIYYKLLDHVPPLEILSHRTVWGFVFFLGVLAVQGRLRELPKTLSTRRNILLIVFAALMISLNWFVFISSVQMGYATDASMGYYTFPLTAVLMGAIFFRERLTRAQGVAVALAASAVITLAYGLGAAPWVALTLAFSFSLYGVVKKGLSSGPVVSVTAEVAILTPFALGWLAVVHQGGGGAFGIDALTTAMLIFAGILTAVPLILFSYATRRVSLATIGLVQYLNPTLQFLVATLIFREAFTIWHAIAFAMIWTALAIYTASSLRRGRAARKAAKTAEASGTVI